MMILPVQKTFTVTRGVTFDYRFQWLQGVPGSATPQPLGNFTGQMTITSWDGVTPYLTLATGPSTGHTGLFFGGDQGTPANGIIDIVIAATDTQTINWQTARYNLVLTDVSRSPNVNYRLLYGSVGIFGFLP